MYRVDWFGVRVRSQSVAAIVRRLALIGILLTLHGCAPSGPAPILPSMHLTIGAPAAVGPDEAMVVFISDQAEHDIVDGWFQVVDEREQFHAQLTRGTYAVVRLSPGRHIFGAWCCSWNDDEAIQADLAPGRVYYVRAWMFQGPGRWHVHLLAVGRTSAERVLIPQWLARGRHLEPDRAILAEISRNSQADSSRRIARAIERFDRTSALAHQLHTLTPEDGDAVAPSAAPGAPVASGGEATALASNPSVSAPSSNACSAGQATSADTAGHCCWPAQAWSNSRGNCVGIPQCPGGTVAQAETCVSTCPRGQSIGPDTDGHCCWPGQAWAGSRSACVGVPSCPAGTQLRGESCVN